MRSYKALFSRATTSVDREVQNRLISTRATEKVCNIGKTFFQARPPVKLAHPRESAPNFCRLASAQEVDLDEGLADGLVCGHQRQVELPTRSGDAKHRRRRT